MAQEKSNKKIKEISDILYKETILPAKEESERIINDAKEAAAAIIHKAQEEAKSLSEQNSQQMSEERKVHESSIDLAVKQAVATLKGEIMNIFNKELLESLQGALSSQKASEDLVAALVKGINDEGISSDLKLFISDAVDFDALSKAVASTVTSKLEQGEKKISSGVALLIQDKKLTLKVTEQTCNELLADKLPEVLRAKVFS